MYHALFMYLSHIITLNSYTSFNTVILLFPFNGEQTEDLRSSTIYLSLYSLPGKVTKHSLSFSEVHDIEAAISLNMLKVGLVFYF